MSEIELKICRICLRTESKVYNYEQFHLKSYYEAVLARKVSKNDDLPHFFCFECATLLHKFHKFKEKCYSGQEVLRKLLKQGPAGIVELLKLSANMTSQDTAVIESPFLETDKSIMEVPGSTDEFNNTGPVEIDSFFINNLDVVLADEKMIGNTPLSIMCSETSNKFYFFPETEIQTDLNVSKSNGTDVYGKNISEDEPIFCDSPSVTQALPESDLENEEMTLGPIENIEGLVEDSALLLCCDLPSPSQVFDESNLERIERNLDLLTENDDDDENLSIKLRDEPTSTISYDPCKTSSGFQAPVIEYLMSDLDSSTRCKDFNVQTYIENESLPLINVESLSTSQSLVKTCSEMTDFNKIIDEELKLDHTLNMKPVSITLPYLKVNLSQENLQSDSKPVENNRQLQNNSKVKLNVKNQLVPNIHSVAPTVSQEYCEAVPDSEKGQTGNSDTEDNLNQLLVEQVCDVSQYANNPDYLRYIASQKQVKPSPCHKKCSKYCTDKLSAFDRMIIHQRYWSMDKKEQQEWLVSCIKEKKINRRQGSTLLKNITYDYIINYGNNSFKVCQQFLMKTLDISQTRFRYAMSKIKMKKEDESDNDSSTYK